MKAIIYDTESGEVLREIRGSPGALENQRLGATEAIVADPESDEEVPDLPDVATGTVPEDLRGKRVNPNDGTVEPDPNATEPRAKADVIADLEAGEIDAKQAILEIHGGPQ